MAIGHGKERRRISTGTNDLGIAKAVAEQIWQKQHAPSSERVEDLWKLYLTDRQKDGRNTSRQDDAWKRLSPTFGRMLGTDIGKDDCRDYAKLRKRLGASTGTVRTDLIFIRACLNLRYGRGNSKVWLPPAGIPRNRYLTRDELEQLLTHVATPHVRLFIILAVTTGARMGALLDLQWTQVDFKHRTINFNRTDREQTNKRRPEVPVNVRAFSALEEGARGALTDFVIEWDSQQVKSIKKAIRMASKRSGVPCSPHVFRHTAGVWMAQADVHMPKISQFLGHTSTRVTEQTYARYSPSFMKDAASALEF